MHIIAWLVLFSFPFLFSGDEIFRFNFVMQAFWLPLGWSFLLFYINYFILTRLLIQKGNILAFIGINLLLMILFASLSSMISVLLPHPPPFTHGPPPGNGNRTPMREPFFLRSFASLFLPVITSLAIRITQRWMKMEAERKEQDHQQLTSELLHLKFQLQPHFFFNSLNSIYALVDSSAQKAKEGIQGLAKLMRYLLYETNEPKVPVSKEISFLREYIQMMQLRTREDVKIEYTFPSDDSGLKIAPLLFIPLVENAFKHGISMASPSFIHLVMEIEGQTVLMSVENSCYPKPATDRSGSGIGLENLKKRLAQLYPKKHHLALETLNSIYCARLQINLSPNDK